MQQCRIIYCSLAALHVSSDIFAYHQEHLNCIYSFWYYTHESLPAGFMGQLEQTCQSQLSHWNWRFSSTYPIGTDESVATLPLELTSQFQLSHWNWQVISNSVIETDESVPPLPLELTSQFQLSYWNWRVSSISPIGTDLWVPTLPLEVTCQFQLSHWNWLVSSIFSIGTDESVPTLQLELTSQFQLSHETSRQRLMCTIPEAVMTVKMLLMMSENIPRSM